MIRLNPAHHLYLCDTLAQLCGGYRHSAIGPVTFFIMHYGILAVMFSES